MSRSYLDGLREESVREYLGHLSANDLLIYSPTSLGILGDVTIRAAMINSRAIGRNKAAIDGLLTSKKFASVTSFGGGTAIDIAKYVSYHQTVRCVCALPMISTNAFATSKSALYEENHKVTLDAKVPDEILIDYRVLSEASPIQNLYGLADVLSIYTALHDWKLGEFFTGEAVDEAIYGKSVALTESLEVQIDNIIGGGKKSVEQIIRLVGESGHITNLYGSGRPESGSEHIFAKALEHRVNVPHGISVSLGVLVMSQLQRAEKTRAASAIGKLDLLSRMGAFGVSRGIATSALLASKSRADRYTILDQVTFDQTGAAALIRKVFKEFGL